MAELWRMNAFVVYVGVEVMVKIMIQVQHVVTVRQDRVN